MVKHPNNAKKIKKLVMMKKYLKRTGRSDPTPSHPPLRTPLVEGTGPVGPSSPQVKQKFLRGFSFAFLSKNCETFILSTEGTRAPIATRLDKTGA